MRLVDPAPKPPQTNFAKVPAIHFCKPHNKIQIFFNGQQKKMGHYNDMWTRYFIALSMGSKNCKNSDISNQNKLKLGVFVSCLFRNFENN